MSPTADPAILGIPSFAKVNLDLRALGRRADGYHELRTIFQTVDLADQIELELRSYDGVEVTVSGADLPADGSNLAARAARAYLDRWGRGRGVAIRLTKRIPVGGGLGGGSSNAAAVLTGLDRLLGPAPSVEVEAVARGLGADVPYFLYGGTALGTGRGDDIRPLAELPACTLWLALAPISCSSAEVFGALASAWEGLTGKARDPRISFSVQGGELDWGSVAEGANDLESVVFSRWPVLEEARDALSRNARFVRLSGSGSTLFALPEAGHEEDLPSLPADFRVLGVRTLSRSDIARRVADAA
jgi:4-diphosphocytidyl-2-C-methyl-D-erythritol kinase